MIIIAFSTEAVRLRHRHYTFVEFFVVRAITNKIPFERRIGCYIVRRLSLIILCGTSRYLLQTPARHFDFDIFCYLTVCATSYLAAYSPSRKLNASTVCLSSSADLRRLFFVRYCNLLVCGQPLLSYVNCAYTVSCSLYRNSVLYTVVSCDVTPLLTLYARCHTRCPSITF